MRKISKTTEMYKEKRNAPLFSTPNPLYSQLAISVNSLAGVMF